MRSSYSMSKWSCQLSIILLVAYYSRAEETKKDIDPPINHDLPLVLINTNTGEPIRLPTAVQMKKVGLLDKRKIIQFSIWNYYNQGFYCPSTDDDDQYSELLKALVSQSQAESIMKEKIDVDCLMKTKPPGAVPAPQCQTQPRPKIMKRFRGDDVHCGPEGAGIMLGFGYQVCLEYEGWGKMLKKFKKKTQVHPFKGTKELTFFDICYINASNEVLFTTNTITGSELFSDPLLEKDRQRTWSIEAYNSIHIPSIDFRRVKWRFEEVQEVSDYKVQLLVHPEDFAMGLWKKPAYHYANASLMHKDLQECWNSIHKKIQGTVWETPAYLDWNYTRLMTGAFKLSEFGTPKIINHVEIPKIWVKIVSYHDSYAVAIIANNHREHPVDNIITASLKCKENLCNKFIEENFPNVLGDIFCCAVTDEIRSLFGIELKSIGILEISGFIVDEEKKKQRERSRTSMTGGSSAYDGPSSTDSFGLTSYAVGDAVVDIAL